VLMNQLVIAQKSKQAKNVLVMCLIILVPFVAGVNTIEVSGFSWSILVLPIIGGRVDNILFEIEQLLVFIKIFLSLCPVQSLRRKVCSTGSFLVLDLHNGLGRLGYKSGSSNGSTLLELKTQE